MKLWLCVDPGETTGYSIWDEEGNLRWADQMPMWNFMDAVWEWVAEKGGPASLGAPEDVAGELKAIICEEWQLYPWELQNLAWDKCRTARVIGALTLLCRRYYIQFILQGADIKNGAQAAGAEALYLEPVHENRHANDSIQHGVFYLAKNGKAPV